MTMELTIETFWKSFENYGSSNQSTQSISVLQRQVDNLWKQSTVVSDASPVVQPVIKIRTSLSETEKWKLQAAARREETKVGGREYNKKVTRATKMAAGPSTDPSAAFPPGRGRPTK